MAKVNVAQFATELKLSADKLVEQLNIGTEDNPDPHSDAAASAPK